MGISTGQQLSMHLKADRTTVGSEGDAAASLLFSNESTGSSSLSLSLMFVRMTMVFGVCSSC